MSLKWQQVNTWRLAQHYLLSRLERGNFLKAVTQTGGLQAQVMSAAELALWARVETLPREAIQTALWQDHTLVKTWAMRGTLYLISANELPLYVAARSLYENRNWLKYFKYYGITETQYNAYLAAAPQVLGRDPMTREQLASAIAEFTGVSALRGLILSKGWGTPLKPLAWRGDLCFGPNQGQNVTFINPKKWLGEWQFIDPDQALQEIVRRYLRAYGPATPADFARWWWGGSGLAPAKKLFKSLDNELEPVTVEGWQAVALRTTLEPMQALEKPNVVNLLPLFDAYTFGFGRGLGPSLASTDQSRVFRPQGWIAAVILVDGYITGVWDYQIRPSQLMVQVEMFSSLSAAIRKRIEAEAERLGAFLNRPVLFADGTEK